VACLLGSILRTGGASAIKSNCIWINEFSGACDHAAEPLFCYNCPWFAPKKEYGEIVKKDCGGKESE
jgi:hypothetical protein